MDLARLIDSNYARILISPRITLRIIVDRDPRQRVIALAIIGGLVGALAAVVQFRSPEAFRIGARAIAAIPPTTLHRIRISQVVVSPFLAVAFLYINGTLLRWSGGLLGGTAKSVEVRAALGWATVPSILTGLVLIAFALIDPPAAIPANPHFTIALLAHDWPRLALAAVLGLYALIISVNCLAEVHRFSAWRGLAAWAIEKLLLAGLFIVLAITILLAAALLLR